MDTRRYLGKTYEGFPHPCLALVLDVVGDYYGDTVPIPQVDNKDINTLRKRSETALHLLAEICTEIDRKDATIGDIVLIKIAQMPSHMGILVDANNVLHIPDEQSGVVIERLSSHYLRHRIAGFYRPTVCT